MLAQALALFGLLAFSQIQARFVAGEVVVRFTSETGGRPSPAEPVDESGIGTFLATVSREIECPLVLRRVGSGGDLLLAMDAPTLAARLERALESHPGVQEVSSASPPEGGPSREVPVAVTARLATDTDTDTAAPALARQLSRDLDLPIVERVLPGGAHLFEVDLRALTLHVVEQLKERPDVDYAQPNYAVSY